MNARLPSIQRSFINLSQNTIPKPVTALQSLSTGDIVSGKIVETFQQDAYLIRLGGQQVTANSRIELSPNFHYSLQVLSTESGLSLKVSSAADQSDLNQQAVKILQTLSLPVSGISRQLVIKMLMLDIPISQNFIMASSEILTQLSRKSGEKNSNDEGIRAFLFLRQNGIPVNEKTLNLARSLFENNMTVHGNLAGPAQGLLVDDGRFSLLIPQILTGFIKANVLAERTLSPERIAEIISSLLNTPRLDSYGHLIYFLTEAFDSWAGDSGYKTTILFALHLVKILQLSQLATRESSKNDLNFYWPLNLTINASPLYSELLYRKMTDYPENFEMLPGFIMHMLVYIKDSSPLHIVITKKVRKMVSIQFHHQDNRNLELLKRNKDTFIQIMRRIGLSSVNITYHDSDTSGPDYRFRLFFRKNALIKTVTIAG